MSTVSTMSTVTSKKGRVLNGRHLEKYTGACLEPGHPSPCTEDEVFQWQAYLDGEPPPPRVVARQLPCRWRSELPLRDSDTGRAVTRRCGSCPQVLQQQVVYHCAKGHGQEGTVTAGDCLRCHEYQAAEPFRLVAPLGTADVARRWEGRLKRPKWEYEATAVVPHLDTPAELAVCVELIRLQTVRPYILIMDTGSPQAVRDQLEALRGEDLEIHYLRSHGYTHSSGPVAAALDAAMGDLTLTPKMFLTHSDVFLRRRDAVEWLLGQCSEAVPVVGWEMSERSWATDRWKGMVSHTFTALYMPTMRRVRPTWSLQAWYARFGVPAKPQSGWPDTESNFNECLRDAGVPVRLLGTEENYKRTLNEWFDHARSYPGTKAYPGGMTKKAAGYMRRAMVEARVRLAEWRNAQHEST